MWAWGGFSWGLHRHNSPDTTFTLISCTPTNPVKATAFAQTLEWSLPFGACHPPWPWQTQLQSSASNSELASTTYLVWGFDINSTLLERIVNNQRVRIVNNLMLEDINCCQVFSSLIGCLPDRPQPKNSCYIYYSIKWFSRTCLPTPNKGAQCSAGMVLGLISKYLFYCSFRHSIFENFECLIPGAEWMPGWKNVTELSAIQHSKM